MRPRRVALCGEGRAGGKDDDGGIEQDQRYDVPAAGQDVGECAGRQGHDEQREGGQEEGEEQLTAGAGVCEAAALEGEVRPEIAAGAGDGPEAEDAEGEDGEDEVGEEEAVEVPEAAVVGEGGGGRVGLVHAGSVADPVRGRSDDVVTRVGAVTLGGSGADAAEEEADGAGVGGVRVGCGEDEGAEFGLVDPERELAPDCAAGFAAAAAGDDFDAADLFGVCGAEEGAQRGEGAGGGAAVEVEGSGGLHAAGAEAGPGCGVDARRVLADDEWAEAAGAGWREGCGRWARG